MPGDVQTSPAMPEGDCGGITGKIMGKRQARLRLTGLPPSFTGSQVGESPENP